MNYELTNGPENDGCFAKIVTVLVVLRALMVALMLAGCKSHEVVREVVRTDTTYIAKHDRDSIWLHDSVHVWEHAKGETIYVELTRWHTQFRDRWHTDTTYIARADTIRTTEVRQVERKLSRWQRLRLRMGDLVLAFAGAVILWGALKLWRKTH
jgi:hypothetical protein